MSCTIFLNMYTRRSFSRFCYTSSFYSKLFEVCIWRRSIIDFENMSSLLARIDIFDKGKKIT
jgi:hypothetical protein